MKRLATEVLAAALLLAGAATVARAGPDDLLWQAITQVESRGNARAYNPEDGATGIAQIRQVCLTDVNRIARRQRLDVRFAASDRNHPGAARRMWVLYLEYYGAQYAKVTGRAPTPEVYARIWNGGPDGWRKASTRGYWSRVRAALEGAGAE